VFRCTARAYKTDKLARRIVEKLLPDFDLLPPAIKVSILLVLIHSEDLADWGLSQRKDDNKTEDLIAVYLERGKNAIYANCDFVFESLTLISKNHRLRMKECGRIPERN
jgi:uncharacterized protein (DUF924 family)